MMLYIKRRDKYTSRAKYIIYVHIYNMYTYVLYYYICGDICGDIIYGNYGIKSCASVPCSKEIGYRFSIN